MIKFLFSSFKLYCVISTLREIVRELVKPPLIKDPFIFWRNELFIIERWEFDWKSIKESSYFAYDRSNESEYETLTFERVRFELNRAKPWFNWIAKLSLNSVLFIKAWVDTSLIMDSSWVFLTKEEFVILIAKSNPSLLIPYKTDALFPVFSSN